jgi:hypothetical protein
MNKKRCHKEYDMREILMEEPRPRSGAKAWVHAHEENSSRWFTPSRMAITEELRRTHNEPKNPPNVQSKVASAIDFVRYEATSLAVPRAMIVVITNNRYPVSVIPRGILASSTIGSGSVLNLSLRTATGWSCWSSFESLVLVNQHLKSAWDTIEGVAYDKG